MGLLIAALLLTLLFGLAVALGVGTHTLSFGWTTGGVNSIAKQASVSVGMEQNYPALSVPASTTNQVLQSFGFTQAKLEDFFAFTDQDLTFKTNSTGSPQDTITLKANIPFQWIKGSGIPCPFAGDVTAGFLTNAGGTGATVEIRVGVDA